MSMHLHTHVRSWQGSRLTPGGAAATAADAGPLMAYAELAVFRLARRDGV